MKCADCKVWVLVEKTDAESTDAATWSGDCRRHAPRAMLEAPLAVAVLLDRDGTTALDPEAPRARADVAHWHERVAVWPVTYGNWFCGDFIPRNNSQGFV